MRQLLEFFLPVNRFDQCRYHYTILFLSLLYPRLAIARMKWGFQSPGSFISYFWENNSFAPLSGSSCVKKVLYFNAYVQFLNLVCIYSCVSLRQVTHLFTWLARIAIPRVLVFCYLEDLEQTSKIMWVLEITCSFLCDFALGILL